MSTITTYPQLLKRIQSEITLGQKRVEQAKAETYWTVGKYIHTHVLKRKRAGYDKQVMQKLAEDLDVNKRLLHRSVQFYREFPKVSARTQLNWTHYKELLSVTKPKARQKLLHNASKKRLTTRELAQEIKTFKSRRVLTTDHSSPITQLKIPTRGPLFTYAAESGSKGYIYIDLGFSITRQIQSRIELGTGGVVQSHKTDKGYRVKGLEGAKKDLYTYRAYLERVIDGDTLNLNIDLGFDTYIKETVRLKSIDAPEIKTKTGVRAKRFVSRCLKQGDIIVKTHWEDKFGRYLVDLWFGEMYLNQQLLDQGLAKAY